MSELPRFEQPVNDPVPRIDRQVFDRMAQQKFAYALGLAPNAETCVQSILDENLEAIEATGDAEAIKFALQNCMRFTDKQLFAQAVFEALKPVLDRQFLEIDSFNPSPDKRVVVNESLSYDIQGDSLRIHIFTGGLGNLSRYVEGLDVVAEVLEQHPEVTTVDAISWIVVKHPDILERKLGFTVQREADKKPTAKIVDGEEIGYAYMDREDFLTKYLKKK